MGAGGGALQQWDAGCVCHMAQHMNGEEVECDQKGRVLYEARDYVRDAILELRAAVSGWTCARWNNCSYSFLSDCETVVELVAGKAMIKFKFLDQNPYIFVHLGEPGIKQQILDAFTADPDSVTSYILDDPALQDQFLAVDETTGIIEGEELKEEVGSLKLIPFQ